MIAQIRDAAVDRIFRLPRIWSNDELRRIAPLFGGDIVNVSAGDDVDKQGRTYGEYFTNKANWFTTNHAPGSFRGYRDRANEFLVDLTEPIADELSGRFDVVFNHTTLEHIFEVHVAFANLCRLSKDVVIVVVPFAQVQHETPGYQDFWRLTPTCLRRLFQENGMTVVYESESPFAESAVYLFCVACRDPEKWRPKMPPSTPLVSSGEWIGRVRPFSAFWFARKLNRVFERLGISGNGQPAE